MRNIHRLAYDPIKGQNLTTIIFNLITVCNALKVEEILIKGNQPEGELVSRSMQTYGCGRSESTRRMDTFRPRLASPTVGPSYTIRHWVQSPTIGPTTGCPLLGILIELLDPVYLVVRGKKPNNCSRYWGLCKPCSVECGKYVGKKMIIKMIAIPESNVSDCLSKPRLDQG